MRLSPSLSRLLGSFLPGLGLGEDGMRALFGVSWLALAVVAVGCAQPLAPCCRRAAHGPATSDALTVVDRDLVAVDVGAVQRLPQVDQILGIPRGTAIYHQLGPIECQCMAVRSSSLGNLFDGELRALSASESESCCRAKKDNSLSYDVIRTAGLESRNRSAGDAMNLYYQLAQNEARINLLAGALAETRQAIANLETLKRQGLKMPPDETVFARREIELLDQQVQVQGAIEQLNAQLWQLIGLRRGSPLERILPTSDLTVAVTPQDIDAEVQVGLSTRPELGMLNRLRRNLDEDSLPAARAALKQINPLLGNAPGTDFGGLVGVISSLKKAKSAQRELPERRRQINQYASQREQEVAAEVRNAAETVDQRVRQIALAKEARDQLATRQSEVERRATAGGATFADVTAARLASIQAEGDLMEKVAEWKIAQARLKQAQGLLVTECLP